MINLLYYEYWTDKQKYLYVYATINIDLLPLEKTMTLSNVIILVKSVWNKCKNNYYYNILLEKILINYFRNKFL